MDKCSNNPINGQDQDSACARDIKPPLVYACKCTGISHVQENKPCQDAYAVWREPIQGNKVIILTVADDHGSKKYDLSQVGSEIAVNTVIDELKKFYTSYLDSKAELAQEFNISGIIRAAIHINFLTL